MSTRRASERLNELVDGGELSAATSLSYQLDAFCQKVRSFCQQNGGSAILATVDRFILSLPVTAAEQVPDLVAHYSDELKGRLAVGLGLNVSEAATACRLSGFSEEVEFYDPAKDYPRLEKGVEASPEMIQGVPNIFDPELPDSRDQTSMQPVKDKFQPVKTYMKPKGKVDVHLSPSSAEQQQSTQTLIQSTMQELGFPAASPQQPQQQPPRDLLEALNGGAIRGHKPVQKPQGQDREGRQAAAERSVEQQIDRAEAEAERTNQKLAQLLAHVKEQLPQIMSLHDRNPDAFKQAMNVISKLVSLARTRTFKSEGSAMEVLEKALRRHSLGYRSIGRRHIVLPVGSRVGRRRKVLVNGKAVWRSVASGQVKDAEGRPISVISSNAVATNE
jgi:hypothetical protein